MPFAFSDPKMRRRRVWTRKVKLIFSCPSMSRPVQHLISRNICDRDTADFWSRFIPGAIISRLISCEKMHQSKLTCNKKIFGIIIGVDQWRWLSNYCSRKALIKQIIYQVHDKGYKTACRAALPTLKSDGSLTPLTVWNIHWSPLQFFDFSLKSRSAINRPERPPKEIANL